MQTGMLKSVLMAFSLMFSAIALSPAALAIEPVYSDYFGYGKAIKGYDPVAYFTQGKPVEGSSDYQYEWMGADWQFASAEHRDLFVANPEKYAPQYGGYCAWAVSEGYTAAIDPNAWYIYQDKLYLNYSRSVQNTWQRDVPGNIARGDQNWPKLLAE
uniref:YHS domain-containing (seleno)protein n=1 Tax=Thaumasiovibrio occultus TaxID=1891184 RepID=UPI000B3627E2|nr:YHS domain-containing (seleno)protein [Thaumasiovibrio occultus]